VVSPETSDHAAGVSALLPMLALGVPGSATAAVMLGGLMIWGLQPGPMLFQDRPDFVWGLIASMYIANLVAVVLVLSTVPIFASVMRVPFGLLAPIIMTICLTGAWMISGNGFDVLLALGFGVIGYLMKKLDYPIAPLVLAMVLGDKAEDAFRQSMLISQGNLTVFWSNWLVGSITTLALLLLAWPMLAALMQRGAPRSRRPEE